MIEKHSDMMEAPVAIIFAGTIALCSVSMYMLATLSSSEVLKLLNITGLTVMVCILNISLVFWCGIKLNNEVGNVT